MTSAPAIGFEYRPSRTLAHLRGAVAVLALVAIASCGLALWLKVLLAILVIALTARAGRRARRSRIVAAGLDQEGGWSLRHADGADVAATLASFRILGAFVLLRLATDERRSETLLLGPDNSDADIRRRLRMRLVVRPHDPVSDEAVRLPQRGASGTLPPRRGPTA